LLEIISLLFINDEIIKKILEYFHPSTSQKSYLVTTFEHKGASFKLNSIAYKSGIALLYAKAPQFEINHVFSSSSAIFIILTNELSEGLNPETAKEMGLSSFEHLAFHNLHVFKACHFSLL
jgi:hypothetical protein